MSKNLESFAKIKRKHRVKEILPDFVVNEHAVFVSFLEAYYEFLSQKQLVTSEKFVDYLNIDSVPQEFLDHFWEEIKEIPGDIAVDKRLLTKHIRDLYASKGTKKSIKLLFRILYNEEIDVYEPKEDLLRASDGKWNDTHAIRTRIPIGTDISAMSGKKLFQYNDFGTELCQFIVAKTIIVQSDEDYLYVEITPSSFYGEVHADRVLYNLDKSISLEIIESLRVNGFKSHGSLYRPGDVFYTGNKQCYVGTVGSGSIDGVFIFNGGTGYTVGQQIIVNDAGAGGAGLQLVVDEIGSGGSVKKIRIISNGRGYDSLPLIPGNGTGSFQPYSNHVGNILELTIRDGIAENNDINQNVRCIVSSTSGLLEGESISQIGNCVISENGFSFLAEDGSYFLSEEVASAGIVGSVFEVESSTSLVLNNIYGHGSLELEGSDFDMILESGDAIHRETSNNVPSTFLVQSSTSALKFRIMFANPCEPITSLDPIYRPGAKFKNDDGFLSQPNKRIQDSLFYQDFSYVIKSAQSFDVYKNILRKTVHPAGMAVFGQVNIDSFVTSIQGRIRTAFDELRLITYSLVNNKISTPSQNIVTIQSESRNALGSTMEYIERNKFNQFPISAGTKGSKNTIQFTRDVNTSSIDNIMDSMNANGYFKKLKFTDIYDYNTFNGVSSGYRLKSRRSPFGYSAYIAKVPAFPIEDIVYLIDAVSWNFGKTYNDGATVSDSMSKQANYFRASSDTVYNSDNISYLVSTASYVNDTARVIDTSLNWSFSKYQVNTVTVIDQLSNFGMRGGADTSSASDVVSFTISSANSINGQSINSGPI